MKYMYFIFLKVFEEKRNVLNKTIVIDLALRRLFQVEDNGMF